MTLVQSTKKVVSGVNNTTLAYPSNPTTGNLLAMSHAHFTAVGAAITAPIDTLSNVIGPMAAEQSLTNGFGDMRLRSYYAENCAGGSADTVTFDIAGAGTGDLSVVIAEFDGIAAASSLDQMQVGSDTSGTSTAVNSGNTPSTTQADELVWGAMMHDSGSNLTITETGGASLVQENEGGAANMPIAVSYKIVAATGAQNATWTISAGAQWASHVVTFKAASAGAASAGTVGMRPQMFHPGAGLWNFARFYQTPRSTEIPSAGTVFSQSVDGALTLAGGLSRSTLVFKDGTLSSSGALAKQTSRSLAATLTPAGALVKQAGKVLAGTLTSSATLTGAKIARLSIAGTLTSAGALLKQTNKVVSGTMASVGSLTRQAQKLFAGTLTSAATVVKQTQKVLAGTLSGSGALTASKVALKSVAGTLTSAGALVRQTQKALSGTLTSSAAIARQAQKAFVGTLRSYGFYFVVGPTAPPAWDSGTTYSAGSIVAGEGANYFAYRSTTNEPPPSPPWIDIGSNTTTQELVKQTWKFPIGTLTSSATLAGAKVALKSVAGALTSSGALAKQGQKALAGTLSSAGTLVKRAQKVLAGTLSSGAALIRQTNKLLAGSLSSAGVLASSKVTSKAVAGALASGGALARQARKAVAGTLAPAATVARKAFKGLAGTLSPAGSLTKQSTRFLSGALTMAGAVAALIVGISNDVVQVALRVARSRAVSLSVARAVSSARSVAKSKAVSLSVSRASSAARYVRRLVSFDEER